MVGVVASETKKWLFFCQMKRILQAVAALRSKKWEKYGGKWAFLGQTACHLIIYVELTQIYDCLLNAIILMQFTKKRPGVPHTKAATTKQK